MTLEVVGAGYSRTGTSSLALALELLGLGPCYHGECAVSPTMLPIWQSALSGSSVDWDALFVGYRSTADLPAALFYKELASLYPSSKVILTVRDPQLWFKSNQAMLSPARRSVWMEFPGWALLEKTLNQAYGGNYDHADTAIDAYLRHNAEVCRAIPQERLLVYSVSEGWPPLCKFLKLPIPESPFPKLNERTASHTENPDAARVRIGEMHKQLTYRSFTEWVEQGRTS